MGFPDANATYKIHNPIERSLLAYLCFGLSHLNELKLIHSFADSVNPLYFCSIKPETTCHFFPTLAQLLKH